MVSAHENVVSTTNITTRHMLMLALQSTCFCQFKVDWQQNSEYISTKNWVHVGHGWVFTSCLAIFLLPITPSFCVPIIQTEQEDQIGSGRHRIRKSYTNSRCNHCPSSTSIIAASDAQPTITMQQFHTFMRWLSSEYCCSVIGNTS